MNSNDSLPEAIERAAAQLSGNDRVVLFALAECYRETDTPWTGIMEPLVEKTGLDKKFVRESMFRLRKNQILLFETMAVRVANLMEGEKRNNNEIDVVANSIS